MSKPRILIVEDEAIIALEIENNIRGFGYEVTSVVSSGEMAMEKAKEERPDLVVMDIRIQGDMDGIEIAEILRGEYGIPVIFSTAYLDKERIDRAKIAMPFGYVLKPIQERDLKITLEMALYVSKADAERRHVEKKLRANEQKYRSLFNSMNDGLCVHEIIYDQDGVAIDYKIIDTNPMYEEILGIKREDVIDKLASEIYGSDDPPYLELYEKVASTGKPERFETYFPPMKKFFLISVFSNHQGGFATVFQDITQRKQSEEALRKSEEKHRVLFETMPLGVVYVDPEGNLIDANPTAEKILGISLEQIKRKTTSDTSWQAIHEDGSDFPGETHPVSIALKTGKKVEDVTMGVFNPEIGDYRWITISAVPLFEEGNPRPFEVYAIFSDVSDKIAKKD